jgi:AcrR family transcriptional regulator
MAPMSTRDPARTTTTSSPARSPTTTTSSPPRYHHGDLRRALIQAAVTTVATSGPAAVSLRGLAAQAGVSHAAPVHHFGDKAGLFTAVAIEGFDELADELGAVWDETADFLEVGVRYVHFALSRPGHFAVMFRADLLNAGDPELARAKERAFSMLHDPLVALASTGQPGRKSGSASGRAQGAGAWGDQERQRHHAASLASWSIVHGLATLVLSGNLPEVDRSDPDALARRVIAHCRPPISPDQAGNMARGLLRAKVLD